MEEIKLVPRNHEEANRLEAKLKSTLTLANTSQFITMYNAGLLSATNEAVKGFVSDIEAAYKNIELAGKKIVVIEEEEVILNGIILLVQQLGVVVQLKRLAKTLIEEGYSADSHIYFSKNDEGRPLLEDVNEDLSPHWMFRRKVADSHEDILGNAFLRNVLRIPKENQNEVAITLVDLIGISVDFVKELQDFIVSKVNN